MWELELFATQSRSDLAFFLSDINILAIYRVSKWDPLVSQIEAASHVCQKKITLNYGHIDLIDITVGFIVNLMQPELTWPSIQLIMPRRFEVEDI